MIQQRFPVGAALLVGGYGYVTTRIGLLDPVYTIRGEPGYCLGSVKDGEFVVRDRITEARLEKDLVHQGALKFPSGLGVLTDVRVICMAQKVAVELAHAHCLTTGHKLERAAKPKDHGFVVLTRHDAPLLLNKWGMVLLKAAQDELLKGRHDAIASFTAESCARTALFCFPETDTAHRREAHLRIVASCLQLPDALRLRVACMAARWVMNLPVSDILADAKNLLESLNTLQL
jgi:hypothetical protein